LIIWGEQDQIVPREHADRFKRDIKGSELVVFDPCGHVPMMERPEDTKREVVRFFKQ
jgi:pimeloyl-ACP methyl ester carboxylesterase